MVKTVVYNNKPWNKKFYLQAKLMAPFCFVSPFDRLQAGWPLTFVHTKTAHLHAQLDFNRSDPRIYLVKVRKKREFYAILRHFQEYNNSA